MALANLNRAQDVQVPTNMLSTIVPREWPTNPVPAPDGTLDPEYLGDVTYNWPYNGLVGDPALPGNDVNVATANATGPYEPKNQGNKANMLGDANRLAVDITTPSGWVDPLEPYAAAPTPTLTNLNPATIAAVHPDTVMVLTGTNFMASSQIEIAGNIERTTYVSPTTLQTIIRSTSFTGADPAIPVRVWNANKVSAAVNFEVTP